MFCVVCVHMQRGAMGDDEVNLFVTLSVWHVSVYGVNVCMLLSVYSNAVTFLSSLTNRNNLISYRYDYVCL